MSFTLPKVLNLKNRNKRQEKSSKHKPRKSAKAGIRTKLYASFGAIALLTLVSGTVGWVLFTSLGDTLQSVTGTTLQSMSTAQRLSENAKSVVAVAPSSLKASKQSELEKENQAGRVYLDALDQSVAELYEIGVDEEIVSEIQLSVATMAASFIELNDVIKSRLDYTAQSLMLDEKIGENHQKVNDIIEPYIDNLRSIVSVEAIALTAEKDIQVVQDGLNRIIGEDMVALSKAMTLQINMNMVAGLMHQLATVGDETRAMALEETFTIYGTRLRMSLLLPDFEGKQELTKAVLGMFDIADAENGLFEMRRKYMDSIKNADATVVEITSAANDLTKNVEKVIADIQAETGKTIEKTSAEIDMGKIQLGAISVSSVIIALLIAWLYVGRSLMRRLNRLVEDMRKIADGDLDTKVVVLGSDEIAEMGHALIGFRDNAKDAEVARAEAEEQRQRREADKARAEREAKEAEQRAQEEKERLEKEAVDRNRAELNKLADDFEGSVQHLVENFAAATDQMSSTSQSMTQTADETRSRSETVATASDQASASVNSVASATEELSSSINEISRQVGQAASIASDAVSEAKRTNEMVTSLSEAASKIGDVVGLINDIAGQTNLLALNATIEAARAGDAGKGFAVEASEVKNLASQTAKATEEISSQINAVQTETNNAVGAIGGISSTIGRISEIATSIASAVEEQGAATGEISRSIQQAAQSTQEVSQNINSVNEAAALTGKSATQVQKVATDLSQEVGSLDQEVNRFLDRVR
ncbi:MAG: HAMP domain-containing protein, partial [Sneathiella sp.]|nr:HAMP domain-containing protein [Sneathiella sp.]